MTKRIKLSAGDYVLLSDIPNEQVFNLVKQCFINAGFDDCSGEYARYSDPDRSFWGALLLTPKLSHCYSFTDSMECRRQLSLSDIFNSVNGGFCWERDTSPARLFNPNPNLRDDDFRVLVCGDVNQVIKRIPEAPEAIIQPEVTQWWDYEKGCAVGIPPVDTECEYSLNNGSLWYKCKVISQYKIVLYCPHLENDDWNGLQVVGEKVMFRPLDYKTPKQIAVQNALDVVKQSLWAGDDLNVVNRTIEALYDNGLIETI